MYMVILCFFSQKFSQQSKHFPLISSTSYFFRALTLFSIVIIHYFSHLSCHYFIEKSLTKSYMSFHALSLSLFVFYSTLFRDFFHAKAN